MVEDGRYDFFDLKTKMGLAEPDASASCNPMALDVIKKLHVLIFNTDKFGTNVISHIDGVVTFVDSDSGISVRPKSVWVCSVKLGAVRSKSGSDVYYAKPLLEITPTFLMSIDESIRESILTELWNMNRMMFIKEFEKKYKNEIHDASVEEVRKEYDEIINNLKSELEEKTNELEQFQIALRSGRYSQTEEPMMELSSDEGSDDAEIDLASESSEVPVSGAIYKEKEIELDSGNFVNTSHIAPALPKSNFMVAPGFPEMRTDANYDNESISYAVERIDEDTLYSESFTDGKYFVHISSDRKRLVVRKRNFGSALCVNHKIRLLGLDLICPFTKRESLIGEYNGKFDGIMIYLDRTGI